ncbi:hypothetical protein PIB30_069326 [Stylosanthes scabra]|uniref:Uncharacterized protein n=1 Tax=Stylosanthes scabra TaxID=79078 RepID=A0ABU6QP23_9FABA|nr:hypothetical protein [Stylosanthes scabra]
MRLTADRVAEGDYVLEAAGSSDRLPFRAPEDRTHFLWVYAELFTRLGVRLPFTDFQREAMTRWWVVASQLHLKGCTPLLPERGLCLSTPIRGESFLTLSRSPSRNLNGTISRFCRFLVGGPFGLMTRVHPSLRCIGIPRWGIIVSLRWIPWRP